MTLSDNNANFSCSMLMTPDSCQKTCREILKRPNCTVDMAEAMSGSQGQATLQSVDKYVAVHSQLKHRKEDRVPLQRYVWSLFSPSSMISGRAGQSLSRTLYLMQ